MKKLPSYNYSSTFFLIFFLQVFISKKSLYTKKINNYERQEKPLRLITCRSHPGNDPKIFSIISLEVSVHTVCNAVFNSSVFCMFNLSSLLSTMDQIFSIILISGLFAGHLSCVMPFVLDILVSYMTHVGQRCLVGINRDAPKPKVLVLEVLGIGFDKILIVLVLVLSWFWN